MHEGRVEGLGGDALRNRMDAPGKRLSREEVAAVKEIAVDFYSIMFPTATPAWLTGLEQKPTK
jgi:hypothetical protein